MAKFRPLFFSWTFVVASLVFGVGAVVAFVVAGDAFTPPVMRFSLLALVCVTVQLIYDEVAGRAKGR